MKPCHIVIKSKTQKSIDNVLFFFLTSLKHLKFRILKKIFKNNKKKTVLTILKSPHVNKKAQEQFEIKYFSNKLTIYSIEKFKLLILLKKLKTNLFSDVDIKTKFTINKKNENTLKIKMFDLDNFKTNNVHYKTSQFMVRQFIKKIEVKTLKKSQGIKNKKTKQFLKILDIYGELNILDSSLNSSVGRALD